MKRFVPAALLPLILLTGCGPKLGIESIAGYTFLITNLEDHEIRVDRVIANEAEERTECVQTPGAQLGPGRSLTVTFFDCGEVTGIAVETDRGEVDWTPA